MRTVSPASGKRLLQVLLGSAAAAALVWLAFRGTDWPAVAAILRRADGRWIVASQVLLVSSHLLRVRRWTAIVGAVRPVAYRTVLIVAQLGFLANVTLPMRLGEGVRAVLLSRRTGARISTSLALVALDRAFDLLGFLFVAVIALAAFPARRDVVVPAGALGNAALWVLSGSLLGPLVLGAAVALAAMLAVLLVLSAGRSTAAVERWTWLPPAVRARLAGAAGGFADGTAVFGSRRGMVASTAASVAAWLSAVASLACLSRAVGLETAWYVAFVMQTLIALFAAAPIAPGLLGQFHLAVIACLLLAAPGVGLTEARAAALGIHFFSILPVVGLGVLGLVLDRRRPGPLSAAGAGGRRAR